MLLWDHKIMHKLLLGKKSTHVVITPPSRKNFSFQAKKFAIPQRWSRKDFLDIFSAQNDCLVIGYLMGTEIFLFWPYLCLGSCSNRVPIKADFAIFQGECGLLFKDFTLSCCQPNVVINHCCPLPCPWTPPPPSNNESGRLSAK